MAYESRPVGGGAWGQFWVPDPVPIGKSRGGGGAGTLTGSAPQTGAGPYGAVPTVPDPTKSIGDYLSGWQQNLPAYTQLIKSINDQANQQARSNLEANLPGYSANLAQQSANISDLLAGKISQSTINNIATAAAERGITTGGGPNANAAYLRALGLTTEGLQAQGAQQFAQQIASTPVGKAIDWATFTSLANEQQQWAYLASVLRASPDPAAAQAANMAAALAGQQHGYNASNTGGGRYSTPITMPTTTTATNPVQDIINKYMPQASGGTAPSAPTTPGWGYVPGYPGGVTTGGTGEVPFEWTGATPTGTPTFNEGDIFQQNPTVPSTPYYAPEYGYWPETQSSVSVPVSNYTPPSVLPLDIPQYWPETPTATTPWYNQPLVDNLNNAGGWLYNTVSGWFD